MDQRIGIAEAFPTAMASSSSTPTALPLAQQLNSPKSYLSKASISLLTSERKMGYYETYSQFYGVKLAIERHRRADEHPSAAWDYTDSTYARAITARFSTETCGDYHSPRLRDPRGLSGQIPAHCGPWMCFRRLTCWKSHLDRRYARVKSGAGAVKKGKVGRPDDDDEDFEIGNVYFLTWCWRWKSRFYAA